MAVAVVFDAQLFEEPQHQRPRAGAPANPPAPPANRSRCSANSAATSGDRSRAPGRRGAVADIADAVPVFQAARPHVRRAAAFSRATLRSRCPCAPGCAADFRRGIRAIGAGTGRPFPESPRGRARRRRASPSDRRYHRSWSQRNSRAWAGRSPLSAASTVASSHVSAVLPGPRVSAEGREGGLDWPRP
jgi:hypothetical protein